METSCHLPIVPTIAPKNPQEIHLVMEYMAGGELYDRLFQQRVYKEERDPVWSHEKALMVNTPKVCSRMTSKQEIHNYEEYQCLQSINRIWFEAFGAMTPMLS